MGLKSWVLFAGLLLSPVLLAGHYYKSPSYPSLKEARTMGQRSEANVLDVGYYYPSMKDVEALKAAKLSKIMISAGHFPDAQELAVLETLKIPYVLILDEVFPSDDDIARLNKSSITQLHIIFRDFPTMGEVLAYNQFTIPLRFDCLLMRLPSVEEMAVINSFKSETTVGFYNRMVPGPGQAAFFNNLNTKKVFVVMDQYPWGMDAEGFNLLENASLEIHPNEPLMPQDVAILNQFNVAPFISMRDVLPMTNQWLESFKAIKASKIVIQDDGTGELLKQEYTTTLAGSRSPVMFRFDSFH